MDATANDVPPQAPFRVQGFPTLKFRPAGSSEFIDYNGDRSLESLVEFIESHRSSAGGSPVSAQSAVDEEEGEWEEEVDDVPEHDEL
jgi:protein disulfide-isomerase A1